jgi:diguanylate cyclase (GGDEF)-like protein
MKNSKTPIKRSEFFESIETYSSLSKSNKKQMALILINIENFSQINRDLGYIVAEAFIYSLYSKIEVLAKFFNCAFRIDGSMFALILPVIEDEKMLLLAANKILNELSSEIKIDNIFLTAKPRLGMSSNKLDEHRAEKIYQKAERLLRAAHESNENFVISLKETNLEVIENFSEKFQSALTHNEFELYYQPKKNLLTNKILNVEALLRWDLEDVGFINPETIIDEAENSKENNFNLTKWVVNKALRQVSEWRKNKIDMCVSVNISASLIHRSDLTTMIEDALKIWSVPAKFLTIEITETAFMTNTELCHENLNNIRKLGIDLSIDDFGTGYSSLSYFKQIPANELKIDKSFILNLMNSKEDRTLVRLMIEIAHSFNLKVVAEGIEDQASYNFLREIGCDYAQGFFIAKPAPADKFIEWLQKINN